MPESNTPNNNWMPWTNNKRNCRTVRLCTGGKRLGYAILRAHKSADSQEKTMKTVIGKTALLLVLGASLAACNGLNTTQRNTAIGAAVGGAAGSMIGGDTGAILGGAALGGVIGSQVH